MEFPKIPLSRLLMLVFAVALVIYGVFNMDSVVGFIGYVVGLLRPFLIGVVIAFILNVPLRLFEQRVFVRVKTHASKKWSAAFPSCFRSCSSGPSSA